MTEPFQVGQFAIVDHEPVERGPNAGIFTGRGPAGDRPELYLLAEGTTPAGEAFAGHVISSAGQRWASFDMSVTGALKRVFDEANANLLDWNEKSIAQHRVRLGMAGFARRGDQYVLAQAGPTAAFHVTRDGVQPYYSDDDHAAPLGVGDEVRPQFSRIDFEPGDSLLMISTAALQEMDDDVVAGILSLQPDEVLPNLFRRVRGLRDVTALFLNSGAGHAASLVEGESPYIIGGGVIGGTDEDIDGDPGYQPSLFISGRGDDDVDYARRQLVAVSERVRQTAGVAPSLSTPVSVPEPLRRAVGSDMDQLAPVNMAATVAATLPRHLTAPGTAAQPGNRDESFTRGLTARRTPPPPPPIVSHARPVSELADDRRARQRSTVPAASTLVTEGAVIEATPLVRVRSAPGTSFRGGGSGALGRRAMPSFKGHPPTWLIALGGILILVIVVGVLAGPQLMSSDDDARFLDLVDDAQSDLATAAALQDAAARRDAYNHAHALLLEAQGLAPESAEVSRLLLEVEEGLNTLDAVVKPAAVVDLANLEQFGALPVTADSMAIGSGYAFLLDGAAGQVIAVPLDGSAPAATLYTTNAAAGFARPISIQFYDSPDLGSPLLLIADSSGKLWAYSGGAPEQLRFDYSGAVTDISAYAGELYVLDAQARTVSRLLPSEGGFAAADVVLQANELLGAARLTVEGEEIYTSDADGTVHRFAGTLSLALGAAGIDEPLVAARTPWMTGVDGQVAVLDPANNRIVVLRPDGSFSHQYQHPDFASSLAMAIEDGVIYVFSGGHVRQVVLEDG